MWAPKVSEKAGIVSHTPKSRPVDPNIAISPFITQKVGLLFDSLTGFCTVDLPQMPGEHILWRSAVPRDGSGAATAGFRASGSECTRLIQTNM